MELGTLLGGRYRIVRELGRGGMGVVYEAVQEDLRRSVAVKVMIGLTASGADYERFVREARIAASVNSPHLVQVYDFSATPPPFLVMELLEGVTLAQRLRQGPLSEAELIRFAREVLTVLGQVHARGVVHRDIKPANLFFANVQGTGVVAKVLDFGIAKLAKATKALTLEGSLLGTVPYMAPEQLLSQSEPTPRADLYAFGVCMYEALAGRRPTTRTDFAGIVAELESGPAPPLLSVCKTVTPALAAIVDRAIARPPEQRFASAEEMLRALGGPSTLAGAPVPSTISHVSAFDLATRTGLQQAPKRPLWPWLLGLGVLGTVAAGVATGVYVASRPAASPTEMATPDAAAALPSSNTTIGADAAAVASSVAGPKSKQRSNPADAGTADAGGTMSRATCICNPVRVSDTASLCRAISSNPVCRCAFASGQYLCPVPTRKRKDSETRAPCPGVADVAANRSIPDAKPGGACAGYWDDGSPEEVSGTYDCDSCPGDLMFFQGAEGASCTGFNRRTLLSDSGELACGRR